MKKVKTEITLMLNENPNGVLESLIGKTIESFYTLNAVLEISALYNLQNYNQELFLKTTDNIYYHLIIESYIEDFYIDLSKVTISQVNSVDDSYFMFRLIEPFLIKRVHVFANEYPLHGEKWHIENIYSEKWHSKERNIVFNKKFFPDIYEGSVSQEIIIVLVNQNNHYLAFLEQGTGYLTISLNKDVIHDYFTGETWTKEGESNPYKLTRTVE